MTAPAPRITIIIPAYNAAETMEATLDSVLTQQGGGCEIIVVDDGSTDSTPAVLAGYGNWVTVVRQENAGPSVARNQGVRLSSGDALLFLDADDCLLPGALARFREALTDEVRFVLAGHETVSPEGRRTLHLPPPLSDDVDANFRGAFLGQLGVCLSGSILLRRETALAVPFPPRLWNYEDRVLLAHLMALGSGRTIAATTCAVFAHPGSLRHRLPAADFEQRVLEAVFDPGRLPARFFAHRPAFEAKLAASRVRRLHQAGKHREACRAYREMVSRNPRLLFAPRPLRRFLRSTWATWRKAG